MTEKSKDYLLKTIVAIILMAIGAWWIHYGSGQRHVLGALCVLVGFAIMGVLYGQKWLWWGSDFFK